MVAIVGAYVDGRPMPSPLELLDERCFGESRRRRGLVALGLGAEQRMIGVAADRDAITIADLALRQDRFLLFEFGRRIVAAFDVGAAEAGELDRLAARGEARRLAARPLRGDLDRRAQHARIDHLRRHRPLPDQLVDLQLVGVEHPLELARRADGSRSAGSLRALPARSCTASDTGAGRRSTRRRTSRGSTRADFAAAPCPTASSSRCGDR